MKGEMNNNTVEKIFIKAIESTRNEGGRWVPKVKVSYEGGSRLLSWERKTFTTKEEADIYASSYCVMNTKQKLNQGIQPEEL